MSFAEVVLRVGVTFVAWIVIYMHLIMLLVVRIAQCPGGDVSPWQVSMVSGLLTLGAAFTIMYGHGVRGVGRVFRYFSLPMLVLAPWAIWVTLPYLSGTTFEGLGVCGVRLGAGPYPEATDWQRAWAPMQLAVLAAIAVNGWRAWRDGARDPV